VVSYFNGHNWLASKLWARKINFEMLDNALTSITDWKKAQEISDGFAVAELHSILDAAIARHCPALAPLGRYHWSIMLAEYATDIVFRSTADPILCMIICPGPPFTPSKRQMSPHSLAVPSLLDRLRRLAQAS
jgi:hypothetical protein